MKNFELFHSVTACRISIEKSN